MISHLHKYKFDTVILNGHKHTILGYTYNPFGINNFHFHYFYGVSSYNNHTHYYSGITGLPIMMENGHVHKIEGILEINNVHEHKFSGFTFEDIANIKGRLVKAALV